ncbi:MAG: biotin--[acetyl-CoA-carboxylase] ligase [Firmicutes bacterium]|nr:biotin--[acetyl-CoA-carboxylase] ligase [Bacillota bacterium]
MDTADRVLQWLAGRARAAVSGEEIARALGVSRNSVWKAMGRLRERGFVIEGRPREGYRLVSCPDVPWPEQVAAGLETRLLGRVEYVPEVGSTNELARERGRLGAPEGSVVVADRQTRGRGRRGRTWHSPAGLGLWFSVLLRPDIPPRETSLLALLSAAAVREAVSRAAGVEVLIKWPNDVVAKDGRKLCGILVELDAELDRVRHCVVGIGINVNHSASDFPPEVAPQATSVRLVAGQPVARVPLLQRILEGLEERYITALSQGFGPVLDEVRRHSATVGRPVTVAEADGSTWDGLALDIRGDGALMVRPAGGGRDRAVYAADVSIRSLEGR